ncbi:transporter, major facilitator family protein [Schaalia georgiae F0490]|uniref:Transporter, major facilitator family protein n=1 Tax=Schaalia georgiae F0490 TaxID=1125717 RepID=J0XM78_9ACTO|nr:MFS transporter [Schaalia georgiae]EJF49701.1 transporter, major facilitator family protein [Schaalia georgiae F0490]
MLSLLTKERRAKDLTSFHRVFLLVLVSIGSSIVYTPAYLQYVFDKPLGKALIASGVATQESVATTMGTLLSAYSWTALICYLPSGIIADRIRVRTLAWVGFGSTALLVYWYAFFPSYTLLIGLFVAMGVTTILIWWGIRFKLVRLVSEEDAYSRNIGISYGLYGLVGLLLGFLNAWIISLLSGQGDVIPMRAVLIVLGSVIMVLALLSFLFIPKFEGEFGSGDEGFNFKQLGQVLSNPVVWLAAATLFFVYFFYTGVNQTTGYMDNVMKLAPGIVLVVGSVRTYGVSLVSAPVFGAVATKLGSPSKVIGTGSVVVMIGLAVFAFLPAQASLAYVAVAMAILLAFIANGVFGICSSQLTEGKVPVSVFGTATGLLSVIGFLPDTFSYIWFGSIRDAHQDNPAVAYNQIFLILAGAALIAAVCAFALIVVARKRNVADEAAPAENGSSNEDRK